jgi:hypothetical protein
MNDMIVIITEVMKGGVTLDGGVLAAVWAAAGVAVVIMSVLAGELKAYQLAASGLLLPAAGMWDNCYLFSGGSVYTIFCIEFWLQGRIYRVGTLFVVVVRSLVIILQCFLFQPKQKQEDKPQSQPQPKCESQSS